MLQVNIQPMCFPTHKFTLRDSLAEKVVACLPTDAVAQVKRSAAQSNHFTCADSAYRSRH